MSLSAYTRSALKAVKTVDAVDLNPNVRAILFPKSDSARYSTHLQENNSVLFVEENISLPSPDASSSEEEDSPTLNNEDTSKTQTHATRRRRNRSQAVILLEQSENTEKFTLGGSSDNEVVLKHPRSADEESCYINLFHAQLYPDPDRDSFILFNGSTSIFYVQSLTIPRVENNIIPGGEATLECGHWQMTVGKGLDFEIKILPWIVREVHYDWVLISPLPVTTYPPVKRSGRPVAVEPTNEAHQLLVRNITPGSGPAGKKIVGTQEVAREVRNQPRDGISDIITQADPGLLASSSPMRESHTTDELIGKTEQTLVFKATRKGTAVAIKVCRKPGVKESADAWKNEFKILKRLNHASIVKLVDYNARDLRLELEYVGQDLSKFANQQRMSQLSEDIAYQIWIDISSGMEYLHANDVVHLDIKAQNILLSESRRAKICDFGYSVQHAIKPIPFNGGTPTYTPPEFVLSGNRWRPADVWGSGLVMGFVLGIWELQPAGDWRIADIRHKPGPAAKMLEWFDKVERNKKRIPDKHSLLLKMLTRDPTKRVTSSDLVKNLRALPQVKALTGELLL